jgi:hypothetical protein
MESPNSPTSTYTTPTCTLNVSTKAKQLSHLHLQQPANGGQFVLEIERDDRGELERTTLRGDLQALDRLQLVVSNYIADLIAKFPLPTAASLLEQPPHDGPKIDRASAPEPPVPPASDLLKNLPGLRNSQAQPNLGNSPVDGMAQSGHGKISKLIGFMNQHDRQNQQQSGLGQATPPTPAPSGTDSTGLTSGSASDARTPKTPYITGGDRSLDHQLHLGELATPESGEVRVLSAIQLFDLATVLDEYAATRVPTTHSGTKVHAQSLAAGGVKRAEVESTASSLARLPNLPRLATAPEAEQVYYRRRRSRSGVMSVIPWAAGAAVLVGGPLLMFGSGANNPLKDLVGKVKMPNFLTADRTEEQKTVASQPTGKQSDRPIGTTSTAPSVAIPKPWQTQSVRPPTTPQPVASAAQAVQPTKNNIGLGTTPAQTTSASNALNPLISGIDSTPSPAGTTIAPSPTTTAVASPKTTATRSVKTTAKPTKSTNISLSTQAIPILQDPIGDISSTQQPKQVAIPPQATPAGGGIDPPKEIATNTPKKASKSAKPKPVVTKPKQQASPSKIPFLTPSASIEPKSYKPNPNLITQPSAEKPVPPSNTTGSESPAPQVVPDRSNQANNGQVGNEAIENTSLQEAKRYFQGKWKATPTQTNVLQYVLDVNNKNGVVKSVNPQGEEADNYLKQSKFIKPGQKLVSPGTGSGDQKIRVLLHPDGNVDTFVEP